MLSFENAWWLILSYIKYWQLKSKRQVFEVLVDVTNSLNTYNVPYEDEFSSLKWRHLYERFKANATLSIQCIELFQKHGAQFLPFTWTCVDDIQANIYLISLYLQTGGDPNCTNTRVHPLLESIWLLEDYSKEWGLDGVHLLTLLISAGADIYWIDDDHGSEDAWTLTDWAFDSEVEEFWAAALEECGFDPEAVYVESGRRLAEYQRLRGASRSGVDVEPLLDGPMEGMVLRYRGGNRAVIQDEY